MLFQKKREPMCSYCTHGTQLEEGQILCVKKGLRSSESSCWRFRYNPFKRIPKKEKAMDFSKYQQNDFSL